MSDGKRSALDALEDFKLPAKKTKERIDGGGGGRRQLKDMKYRTNDEIYGTIRFCSVVKAFIDTPQFQRLRSLKQLATSDKTFMCSNHTRFEHSMGVSFLAERMMKRIKDHQKGLHCTSKDVLCVRLGGLLHDIGHGPYSHTYENFVKFAFSGYFKTLSKEEQAKYKELPKLPPNFGHEEVSLMLVDAALAHLGLEIDLDNLDTPLKEIGGDDNKNFVAADSMRSFDPDNEDNDGSNNQGILTSRDFVFIKECIWGKPIPEIEAKTGLNGFIGRPLWENEYMYDVVSNRHSGLDVDKVDYFTRDARRCFGEGPVNEIILEEAVVAWGSCTERNGSCKICRKKERPHPNSHLMICYPQKTVNAIINFFNERYRLHSTVYWHKTTVAASHMVCDILCYADPYLWITTKPKDVQETGSRQQQTTGHQHYPLLPISRAMTNVNAFMRLRDSIIDQISESQDKRLERARDLADRFIMRDLYKCAGEYTIDKAKPSHRKVWKMTVDEIKSSLLSAPATHDAEASPRGRRIIQLGEDDIIVDKFCMHHGQCDRNPLHNIRTVDRSSLMELKTKNPAQLPVADRPKTDDFKANTPMEQQQCKIRVFCRSRDQSKRDLLIHAFEQWICSNFWSINDDVTQEMDDDETYIPVTPSKGS